MELARRLRSARSGFARRPRPPRPQARRRRSRRRPAPRRVPTCARTVRRLCGAATLTRPWYHAPPAPASATPATDAATGPNATPRRSRAPQASSRAAAAAAAMFAEVSAPHHGRTPAPGPREICGLRPASSACAVPALRETERRRRRGQGSAFRWRGQEAGETPHPQAPVPSPDRALVAGQGVPCLSASRQPRSPRGRVVGSAPHRTRHSDLILALRGTVRFASDCAC